MISASVAERDVSVFRTVAFYSGSEPDEGYRHTTVCFFASSRAERRYCEGRTADDLEDTECW